jgi:hypothetical protein
MSKSLRNYIIVIFLLCCWIPFVLITDLFPFMRLGMFAEPIKEDFQTERFQVRVYEGGQMHVYDPSFDGTDASVLHYLARNHYYRNQTDLFLQKLKVERHYPKADSVLLIRFTQPFKHSYTEESHCIGKLILTAPL